MKMKKEDLEEYDEWMKQGRKYANSYEYEKAIECYEYAFSIAIRRLRSTRHMIEAMEEKNKYTSYLYRVRKIEKFFQAKSYNELNETKFDSIQDRIYAEATLDIQKAFNDEACGDLLVKDKKYSHAFDAYDKAVMNFSGARVQFDFIKDDKLASMASAGIIRCYKKRGNITDKAREEENAFVLEFHGIKNKGE